MVAGLPVQWRETLSTNDFDRISSLRKAIRDLEIARDGWPTPKDSNKQRSNASPRESKGVKRGGGFGSPNFRKKGRSNDNSSKDVKKKKGPPYPCPNCKKINKADDQANHWIDECPVAKDAITNTKRSPPSNTKRANFVDADMSDDDECKTEQDNDKGVNDNSSKDSSDEETDGVNFVNLCSESIISRLSNISEVSNVVVDSLPEKDKWRPGGKRFENQSPVIVMARTSLDGANFPVMCDTGSAASLIGRQTFVSRWANEKIKRMDEDDSVLRIKAGWDGQSSEKLLDYATPSIFLPTEDRTCSCTPGTSYH